MSDAAAERILLVGLEDRVLGALPAVEDHVEDGVEPAGAAERPPELALVDTESVRRLPAPVQDSRDEPATAQAPSLRGAAAVPFHDFELDPFPGHSGAEV